MESILTSIKKLLGITEDYDHFDSDIIMHINSTFMVLNQLGVGPSSGFAITDKTSKWSDFIPDITMLQYEAIKTYMYLKVKLVFDPPLGGTVMEAYKEQIKEYESRLNIAAESDPLSGSGGKLDYNDLDNLPSINGETLKGNYNEKDPTVKTMPSSDVDSIWKDVFGN
jgi:hypothetical protein